MKDKSNWEKVNEELTLMLMYLNRFKENEKFEDDFYVAWKGYNFNALNRLEEERFLIRRSRKAKSVLITDEGIERAEKLLDKYGIEL